MLGFVVIAFGLVIGLKFARLWMAINKKVKKDELDDIADLLTDQLLKGMSQPQPQQQPQPQTKGQVFATIFKNLCAYVRQQGLPISREPSAEEALVFCMMNRDKSIEELEKQFTGSKPDVAPEVRIKIQRYVEALFQYSKP